MRSKAKKGVFWAPWFFVLLLGCATHNVAINMLPSPPDHPALKEPERLSQEDRTRLADFYRRYELYIKKLDAYKKAFG